MIITKLVLKNWRNFRSASISLRDRAFIIGVNASGKSNLLDVFRFLRDVAKGAGGLGESRLGPWRHDEVAESFSSKRP